MAALSAVSPILERFEVVCARIDAEVTRLDQPLLRQLQQQTGLRYAYLILGASFLLFAFIFLGFGAAFFSHIIGFLYPAYASFKAIESAAKDDDKQWLTYWVVFAVFSTIEVFSDTIVWWFPFYWSAKVMFLVYLQLPQFRGAEFLYNTFIRQLFQKHAPAIEAKFMHVRDVSNHMVRAAGIDLSMPNASASAAAHAVEEAEVPADVIFGPSVGSRKAQ